MKLRNKIYNNPVYYQKRKTRMTKQQLIKRIEKIIFNNMNFFTNELFIYELIIETFPDEEIFNTWNKSINYIINKINKIYIKEKIFKEDIFSLT